jgi:tetratricopeptide (TPR) repeat protein
MFNMTGQNKIRNYANKLFSISFCLLIFITQTEGQATTADSLNSKLLTSKGTDKLEVLDRLIEYHLFRNPDTAYFFANKLLTEAGNMNNKVYQSLAWRGISICNFYEAKYYQAEEDIQKAVKLQEQTGDTAGIANSYKILTGIYWETERYNKSIEISFKALRLYEATDDIKGVISSLNNIGLIYKRTGDIQKSLENYKQALSYIERNDVTFNRGNLYNNIGISYRVIAEYDSSLYYYHKALSEYQKKNLKNGIATVYLNIGNIFLAKKAKNDSALIYLKKALILAGETDKTQLTEIYSGLGKYYLERNNYQKSLEAYNKVLSLAHSSKDRDDEKDAHFDLYSIYKKIGDKDKALSHLIEYVRLKDTLDLENSKVTIANLEAKFENEKKQLQIEKLQEKQKADKHKKSLLWIVIVFLFVTLSLTVVVFILKRKKAKLRRELLKTEKEKLEKDVQFKSRQLTSQALMMMQKNQMLGEIFGSLKSMQCTNEESKKTISSVTKQLKRSIHSEEDWELFRHYFEEINPDFYPKILDINNKITPSELKLSALIKLNFSIKETASLLNISPDSVKTTRHVLRTKLGLAKGENIHEFLNRM